MNDRAKDAQLDLFVRPPDIPGETTFAGVDLWYDCETCTWVKDPFAWLEPRDNAETSP